MADEIQEAVQIVRVAYDGIEIAMKVGSGGISAIQKTINALKGMLDYEKSLGKTSMKKLLMRGGDLQVLQFSTEDMKKAKQMAKKYGILYSVLPDINKKDGQSEIIFHSEAVPRVNMIIQKLKAGRIATFDDYLKNGNEKELEKLTEFFKEQKLGNENTPIKKGGKTENTGRILQDQVKEYQELTERMRVIAAAKDTRLSDITISNKMIVEHNDHAVKVRVPGDWGKYMWIEREDMMEIHKGKTILTFLDQNKDYKLYDDKNKVIEEVKGEKLYANNYDKVEAVVKNRYEQSKSQIPKVKKNKNNTIRR